MSIIKILSYITNPADMVLNAGWRHDQGAIGSLWVGSLNALSNDFLSLKNIGVIVSLCPTGTGTGTGIFLSPHITHHQVMVRDHVDDQHHMLQLIPGLINTIHHARLNGYNVLVHCHAGIQRAPTVTVMYLHRYYNKSIREAINKVQRIRPIAFVNGYTFRQVLGL